MIKRFTDTGRNTFDVDVENDVLPVNENNEVEGWLQMWPTRGFFRRGIPLETFYKEWTAST